MVPALPCDLVTLGKEGLTLRLSFPTCKVVRVEPVLPRDGAVHGWEKGRI